MQTRTARAIFVAVKPTQALTTLSMKILHRVQMGQDVYIQNTYVPNIYIQDLKTLKMQKDVGMACQKVCKQGRDDIIVKVNLQCLILASFSH